MLSVNDMKPFNKIETGIDMGIGSWFELKIIGATAFRGGQMSRFFFYLKNSSRQYWKLEILAIKIFKCPLRQ